MRINIKEKEYFLEVFKDYFNQSFDFPINGISIDSRNIKKNDIFIALSGENVDGNDFIEDAFNNGASYALTSIPSNEPNHILINDISLFMKDLCTKWLKRFNGKIVGITGSNGKTTTKDLVCHILQSKFKVEKTLGNYNTSISVPLSILSFSLDSDIYVLELGANKVGDIEYLSSIVKPDYGIVTNISEAHLDGFGSYENIENEKKSIFLHSTKKYNFNENKPGHLSIDFKSNKSRVFSKNLEISCHIAKEIFKDLIQMDITADYLDKILANFEIPSGRGDIIFLEKNIKLIDDSYNANPESVKAALDYLDSFKHNRKLFVFGDMKELGKNKESFHTEIGKYAIGKTDILLTVGNLSRNAQSNSNNFSLSLHFNDNFSLIKKLNKLLIEGDVILVKGSRSMYLDQIINELKNAE